jgi:hypothetical protein
MVQEMFGSGGFPGSTPETIAANPALSPTPMVGDQAIRDEVSQSQLSKMDRQGTKRKKENTSVYTQVSEELREFLGEMRSEVRKELPAKFMKVALTRKQVKTRMEMMSQEELQVMTRKYGVRMMGEFMKNLGVKPNGSR